MPHQKHFSMHVPRLNNQRGAALILAVLMLATLTLLGISATTTGLIEIDIARNETFHDMAFYEAESGWRHAVSWLDLHPSGVIEHYGSVAAPATFAQAFSVAAAAHPKTVAGQNFAAAIRYIEGSYPPLWGSDYRRLHYRITAAGAGPGGAEARVEVHPGKIFRAEGY